MNFLEGLSNDSETCLVWRQESKEGITFFDENLWDIHIGWNPVIHHNRSGAFESLELIDAPNSHWFTGPTLVVIYYWISATEDLLFATGKGLLSIIYCDVWNSCLQKNGCERSTEYLKWSYNMNRKNVEA